MRDFSHPPHRVYSFQALNVRRAPSGHQPSGGGVQYPYVDSDVVILRTQSWMDPLAIKPAIWKLRAMEKPVEYAAM